METQNLEWLIFNALHGDVNGNIPEDLQVVIKAEQELHALLARHNALVEVLRRIAYADMWTLEKDGSDAGEQFQQMAEVALIGEEGK